ncbi:MAG: hypothetical protein WHS38_12345 [Thermodesulforhabdaceae bacterium]
MDVSLFNRRKKLGIMCAICCLVFLIALVDGLLARFRQNPHEFHVLPGAQISVIGPLPPDIQDLEKLKLTIIPEKAIRVTLLGTKTGYWLGGTLWQGVIEILPEASQGKYIVKVTAPAPHDKKPLREFTIFVHSGQKDLQKVSLSMFRRYMGINPWIVSCGALGTALFLGGTLFLLSSRIDRLLRLEGFGEIYRVIFDHEGRKTYVFFGLGKKDGISEEDILEVFNTDGKKVGRIEAKDVYEGDSIGLWKEGDILPKPGFLVKRQGSFS